MTLRKVFLLPLFGAPHAWTQAYLDHVRALEPYGWHWKVFTPHPYPSGGNVEIVPMTIEEFDRLVEDRCGMLPGNRILGDGGPAKLLSDYYPAFGDIFADYLGDADYWGHTNWDMVYGRLDHFIPDTELEQYSIWSDDPGHINGIFTLYRNGERERFLYRGVRDWPALFRVDHPVQRLVGFDEFYFDAYVRAAAAAGTLAFGSPPYFPYHSYDHLIQHRPEPKLMVMQDGALVEWYEDNRPNLQGYAPWPGMFGREIMSFHFIRTKAWPTFRPAPAGR